MANDALERLYNSNNQEQSEYTLEEQLEGASDDDFLEGMSDASKDALLKSITEVTLDDNTQEEVIEEDDGIIVSMPEIEEKPEINENENTSNEALFNNNRDEKKSRKPRKPKTTESKSVNTDTSDSIGFNPIMDQLAKDVIDDLRKRNYKISRFDDSTMELVFAYMYKKF